uniref:Uncharacterized protein n=1 Tax=Rhizophora mucronata TaxID=61149 RepID=A0A2P2QCI8_RHIMU
MRLCLIRLEAIISLCNSHLLISIFLHLQLISSLFFPSFFGYKFCFVVTIVNIIWIRPL